MANFIPLEELRDRVWPVAVAKKLATDMTGVSLPLLDFTPRYPASPYRVIFLLYYAVPDNAKHTSAKVSRAYAQLAFDAQTGELVETKILRPDDQPNPLVGPGSSDEVMGLPADDRRRLQDILFELYNQAAQAYAENTVTPEQADGLADLIELFLRLAEPPLAPDYETAGQPFFAWLRQHAQPGHS